MNSSMAATLPLIHTSSHHQRVRALFFSSASDTGASSLLTRVLPTVMHDASREKSTHLQEVFSAKCLEKRSEKECDQRSKCESGRYNHRVMNGRDESSA